MLNSNHSYSLHLITALACEAKPLIKNYGLKRCIDEPAYPVFRNETMTLTVSGIGKLAATAAVAYTQGRYGHDEPAIWLNIGVAGHHDLDIGDCCIAHKITDQETSRNWYPSLLYSTPCKTSEIVTVSQPETDYNLNCLYEMEAAGFFASAIRFTSLDLIHSLKVISDNHSTPAATLNQKIITNLIDNQLSLIDSLVNALDTLRQNTIFLPSKNIELIKSQWHFTTHQITQLSKLMSQWQILSVDTLPTFDCINHLKSSKQVIKWLEHQVSILPIRYD